MYFNHSEVSEGESRCVIDPQVYVGSSSQPAGQDATHTALFCNNHTHSRIRTHVS